jgi:hypothetical protein
MTNNQIIKALYARYGQDNWCHKPCVETADDAYAYTAVVGTLNGPVNIEVAQTDADMWEARIWSDFSDYDFTAGIGNAATLEGALDEAGDEFAAMVDEYVEEILKLKKMIRHL